MKHIAIKYLFNIFSGSTPESGQTLFYDGEYNWFTPDDLGKIGNQIFVTESKRKVTDEGIINANLRFAKPNSIVITKRAPIGNLAIASEKSSCNQGCFILEQKSTEINIKYYYYFFKIQKDNLNLLGRGSTFLELNADEMKGYHAPYPTLSQQNRIVDYLDKEITKIDSLIEKKSELIELLDEKKKAVINLTITKGLDPNVPLKKSGIEWLGEVPENWDLVKLKYLVTKIDELNDYEADFKIAVENIKGFSGKLINLEKLDYEGNTSKFKINDIIFNKLRPYLGKVYLAKEEGGIYGELLILRPNEKLIPKFLFYIMISTKFIDLVNSSSTGTKMPRASWEDFIKYIYIPVIPIGEQHIIVEYLDKTLDENDELSIKLQNSIDLLKEKRSAIISAAINGKIDL